MRSAAAAPRGPSAAIEPRRFAAARWPGRRSLPRPARRGGRGGGSGGAPTPYPSAAPPPPGPGPPPSEQRSPPSASDCFGSNGNGGSAPRPGSRRLLGFRGPPRPFVVLLLPLAGPGAPPAAPTRASPLGARASPPRSGVSSARPAPGCPRPACGPVYGPLTMSLKPQQQQQQQQPVAANVRKPGGGGGGGLLTSPAAPSEAAAGAPELPGNRGALCSFPQRSALPHVRKGWGSARPPSRPPSFPRKASLARRAAEPHCCSEAAEEKAPLNSGGRRPAPGAR
ncbi:ataxin-2-like [Physeter macrocephalus]|uniref:Ataxin-2-like n=1 Tax=Physeter macrocephalus TaxID=9755 RepID=A0A9W2WBT2_PHYMC|nr:ataxin-2-like [Physeter catodon]